MLGAIAEPLALVVKLLWDHARISLTAVCASIKENTQWILKKGQLHLMRAEKIPEIMMIS